MIPLIDHFVDAVMRKYISSFEAVYQSYTLLQVYAYIDVAKVERTVADTETP
jgi:hypothetical protein